MFYSSHFILALSLLATLSPLAAQRLYVDIDATGNNDGTSWADAFTDLQDAIDAYTPGDSIWVAEGVYVPTRDTTGNVNALDRRLHTFYINQDDIKIFGGFMGAERAFLQRDIDSYPTVLSGDLGGDSTYHVVYIDGTTTRGPIFQRTELNGFTIADGRASGALDFQNGAGMFVNGSETGNVARPTVKHCIFRNNAAEGSGGAIYNDGKLGNSSPDISYCTFSNNSSNGGGAIYNDGINRGESSPKITHSYFYNNNSVSGGAIFNSGFLAGLSSPVISNCVFYQNTALFHGGAMYNYGERGECSPQIINCSFSQNKSGGGGAVASFGGSADKCFPKFKNCILWRNREAMDSTSFQAQLSDYNFARSHVSHCLINGIDTLSTAPLVWSNNIDAPPRFVDPYAGDLRIGEGSPAINAGRNDTAGYVSQIDLDGNPRISGGIIDMGAYEYIIPPILRRIFVDIDATGNNDGTGWADAFTDLQDAIDAYTPGDSIWVAEGVYLPTRDFSGDSLPADNRSKTFTLFNDSNFSDSLEANGSIKIFGGFQGIETELSQRDFAAHPTTLSGDLGLPDSAFDNAYRVVSIAEQENTPLYRVEIELDGLTVAHGNADARPNQGGGLVIVAHGEGRQMNSVIRNCRFEENSASGDGGAIYNATDWRANSLVRFENCSFVRNASRGRGGAIANTSSDVISPQSWALIDLVDCTFEDNYAAGSGGAISSRSSFSYATIHANRCTFTRNRCNFDGGAIISGSNGGGARGRFSNCVFTQNLAGRRGGALVNTETSWNADFRVVNCTFGKNRALGSGGAIFNLDPAARGEGLSVINSIVWGNISRNDSTRFASQIFDTLGAVTHIAYSLANGLTGLTNQSATPFFRDAAGGDFRLTPGSPAINAGNNDSIPAGITTDLAGDMRIQFNTVDMGAYESGFNVSVDPAASPLATLRAYPNPATDRLTVEWELRPGELRADETLRLRVFDLQGRVVRVVAIPATQSRHELDLTELAAGVYTLRVAGRAVRWVKL